MGISILAWLSSRDPILALDSVWANKGRGIITRPIWKCPYIKLFITYFRHLEKRHPYWPETKSRPILARAIWASIWKWSCSNPITGYYPGVWKYGQFTSGHIGHAKMPLFELSMLSTFLTSVWLMSSYDYILNAPTI